VKNGKPKMLQANQRYTPGAAARHGQIRAGSALSLLFPDARVVQFYITRIDLQDIPGGGGKLDDVEPSKWEYVGTLKRKRDPYPTCIVCLADLWKDNGDNLKKGEQETRIAIGCGHQVHKSCLDECERTNEAHSCPLCMQGFCNARRTLY